MPLIGVDDMETPYWAQGYEKVVQASLREVAVAVPRTMAQIVRWAWRAAPRLTLLTGALQLSPAASRRSGCSPRPTCSRGCSRRVRLPSGWLAALPALAVVVAAYAARGLLDAAEGAAQAALAPRVQRMAEDDLYVALIDVDLVAFDEPDFTQLVERVTDGAPSRVRAAVRQTSDLTALAVSMCAGGHRGGDPAPGAGADRAAGGRPTGLGPGQGGEAGVRLVAAHVVARPTARRGQRADLAAGQRGRGAGLHHAGGAARRAPPDRRRPAHRVRSPSRSGRTARRRPAARSPGSAPRSATSCSACCSTPGAMPLALAGTAVLAMRAAASAIVNSMFQVSQLYESGFTLELYRTLIADARARSRPPGQGHADRPRRDHRWTASRSAIPAMTSARSPTSRSRSAAAR